MGTSPKVQGMVAACSLAAAVWATCGAAGPGKPEATPASLAAYDAAIADARRCAGEERCVIAGGVKGCRCRVAVRSYALEAVDRAARMASCPQVERLYCPPLTNPRCESGRCVADSVPD